VYKYDFFYIFHLAEKEKNDKELIRLYLGKVQYIGAWQIDEINKRY